MGKCGKCRSKIGFFGGAKPCSNASCDYEECPSCSDSKTSNLKACKNCGEFFCTKHIDSNKHICEEKEQTDEETTSYKDTSTISGRYSIKINLQDGNFIEFNELDKSQAEEVYNEIKKAINTQQNWYELDVQKHFGKEAYSFEKTMINVNQITNFKIEGE